MSLALVVGGRHSAGAIVRRLRRQVRDLEADNQQLTCRADEAALYAHQARIQACRDAMVIARLRTDRDELAAAVERMDEQHNEEIRAHQRHIRELTRRLELRSLTDAAAAETQEIPVITAVIPLHQSPQARRSPGHVPAWVKDQPDPAA
jgi:hypothetical protein